jgi:hypothetical protein
MDSGEHGVKRVLLWPSIRTLSLTTIQLTSYRAGIEFAKVR